MPVPIPARGTAHPAARRPLLAAALLALAAPRAARSERTLWFDPTQLPSFTGRLERWIMNPAGDTDRGLFREGSQFVFRASEAEALTGAAGRGDPLTIWGIRARSAPIITMLAWARREDEAPQFVERPGWFPDTARGHEPLSVDGQVQLVLLTPQGEPMGVLLQNGGVVRLPVGVHRALGDRLAQGARVAASGPGTRRGEIVALDAERIGRSPDALSPLPEPRP